MCLIISKNYKKKIADRDIVCYKVLGKDYYGNLASQFQNFKYQLNTLYKENIALEYDQDKWFVSGDKEAEDYRFSQHRFEFIQQIKDNNLVCYGKGFHSYGSYNRAKLEKPDCRDIVKCTIPRGSEYIRNKSNCIISNQIIINEICGE